MAEDVTARVLGVIARAQKIPVESVTIDKTYADLNIDSLDGIELLFELEKEFDIDIPDDSAHKIRTVRETVEGVEKLLALKKA